MLFKNTTLVASVTEVENRAFDKKVGKIRVLCHPKVEAIIMSKWDRQQIFEKLSSL